MFIKHFRLTHNMEEDPAEELHDYSLYVRQVMFGELYLNKYVDPIFLEHTCGKCFRKCQFHRGRDSLTSDSQIYHHSYKVGLIFGFHFYRWKNEAWNN